ncbi:hypothetical protein GQ457_13G029670 [Hibiscus cannabinus]
MKTLCCLMQHLLFLLSCFLSLSLSQTHLPKHYCLDDQRSPLLQLQTHLYSDFTFSSKFELWDLHSDCCSWEGVSCDSLGHVIGLDLSYKNLFGSFHSIFDLHHLRRLNLAGNNFNTTMLSYGFGKLQNLTHLNLSSSCFHGQIPVELSNLTRLVSLDLSYQDDCYRRNDAFDYYYLKLDKPNLKTLIKNMKFLTELYLDGVDISSESSKWCETTSLALSNLQVLSLSWCGLEGPLCTSHSTLPFLSKFVLDHNPITYLPSNFLENSSRLVSLSLKDCNLSGHFPTEILLLPKVQSIDISYNEGLEGQLPEFPSNNALRSLRLYHTNFSGKLPKSIGNLKFLTDLTLVDCNFFGSIPSSIANLSHLVNLDLSDNHFSGSIPSSLFTLSSLRVLYLGENHLVGKIDEFPNASTSVIEKLLDSSGNVRTQANVVYCKSENRVADVLTKAVSSSTAHLQAVKHVVLNPTACTWLAMVESDDVGGNCSTSVRGGDDFASQIFSNKRINGVTSTQSRQPEGPQANTCHYQTDVVDKYYEPFVNSSPAVPDVQEDAQHVENVRVNTVTASGPDTTTTSGSRMNASSDLFTSAPVHVVPGLDKQTDNLVQSGQTSTDQAVSAQECDGSASFEQAGLIQENSGNVNTDQLELPPAIEVLNDERCAQTSSGNANSDHLELSPAVEDQNDERCAQTNSGNANFDYLELSPAIEVQNDERCAQTNSGQGAGHLELPSLIEAQNNERCAHAEYVDPISTRQHGASVEECDVTSMEISSEIQPDKQSTFLGSNAQPLDQEESRSARLDPANYLVSATSASSQRQLTV